MTALIERPLSVVNVGLGSFADSIEASGGAVTRVEWRPPAAGDREAGAALARLLGDGRVATANEEAFARYLAARPALVGIAPAREVVPGLGERTLLHSGPPIEFARMSGPGRGAIVGAILLEGWAVSPEDAEKLAASGEIAFDACHHHGAVGPMAGVISPSMPVWVVNEPEYGGRSFSNLNEGLGKVLRFGAFSEDVLSRLRWMGATLAPALAAALEQSGPVELKPLVAQALHMGDEVHNRNVGATSLLFRKLAPAIARTSPTDVAAAVLDFIGGNDHSFLNISMASCKAMLDAAHGVAGSSMVTAMSRNGVEFGVRLSGTGDEWFLAPAPMVDGLFFAGYSAEDAAPDLGDSAIAETAGLGGFAMGAAPAIVQFVGGTPNDAIAYTREMRHITLGANPAFTLPPLGFAPTPAGIDALKVVDRSIQPVINTGIAHKEAGVGQVGAGVTRAPLECFARAVKALDAALSAGGDADGAAAGGGDTPGGGR